MYNEDEVIRSITRQIPLVDKRNFADKIINLLLQEYNRHGGVKKTNQLLIKLGLDKLGWEQEPENQEQKEWEEETS